MRDAWKNNSLVHSIYKKHQHVAFKKWLHNPKLK
jgi:hypothetical protein